VAEQRLACAEFRSTLSLGHSTHLVKPEASKTAKTKNRDRCLSFALIRVVTTVLHLGAFGVSGQTSTYLYTGSKATIPLYAGKYNITAYGARGGAAATAVAEVSAPKWKLNSCLEQRPI
jgi:hypothetical protein